jgi:hypothetical protein
LFVVSVVAFRFPLGVFQLLAVSVVAPKVLAQAISLGTGTPLNFLGHRLIGSRVTPPSSVPTAMSAQRSARQRLVEDPWMYGAAVSACCVVTGVYVGRTGSLMPLVALAAVGTMVFAISRPRVALAIGLAAIALPYTWGPQISTLGFGSGIVVGLLFLIAYASTLTRFRPSALDLAVLAFAVTPAASAELQGQPLHISNWIAAAIVFPYFGFRLLFHATDARRDFATAIVAVGVVVALIGIWEGITGHNPIVHPGHLIYSNGGHYTSTWNVVEYRNGHVRALSTFGHPIAFGMFLAIPLAFALARGGLWNLASAGVILVAEVLTYSRGGWIACLVVVLLLAGRNRGRIVAAATVIIAGAIFIGPINQILTESTSASTEAGNTTYYRVGLLSHAFDGVSLLGHPFADLQSAFAGHPDVTSLVAGTIVQTGLVGLLELALIACCVIVALVSARRQADHDYRAATAALTAQLVGLISVALITNYQFFFWVLVAYVATLWQGNALAGSDA